MMILRWCESHLKSYKQDVMINGNKQRWGWGEGSEVPLRLIWVLSFSVLIANVRNGINNTQTKFRNDSKLESISNTGAVKEPSRCQLEHKGHFTKGCPHYKGDSVKEQFGFMTSKQSHTNLAKLVDKTD